MSNMVCYINAFNPLKGFVMGVYKQRGSENWYAVIYVRGSGRAGKKTIRVSTRTADRQKAEAVAKTLELAQNRAAPGEALHHMIDQLLGAKRDREGIPLAELFSVHADWLAATNRQVSVSTMRNRKGVCARFAQWAAAHYPAASLAHDVDKRCAIAFANHLMSSQIHSKTRRNIVGELSAIWSGLLRTHDGIANPWPLAMPQATGSKRLEPFTRDEEARILDAADRLGHGWGLACRIARATGLRYGDVATLRWSDVDFEGAAIRDINPRKTRRHGIQVDMPIGPRLAEALRIARAESPDAQDGFVLPELGRPYPAPFRPCSFRAVLAAAGVDPDGHTFHSWRHLFRTSLAEAGVGDDIAKRLGGWKNDNTALHYEHGGRWGEMRAAIELIDSRDA
jgi:hypothetical protein